MNDKVFLDTNILVYSYSDSELHKQNIARLLITDSFTFISTQVLQELTNVFIKKFKFSYPAATEIINECCENSTLIINDKDTVLKAHKIAERHNFSFYDSLIISAALECDCSILYSEDMQSGQLIEKRLKIINPFK